MAEHLITRTPIPLSRDFNVDAVCANDPVDKTIILGSFWPNSLKSYESCLVKSFKECYPADKFEPDFSTICDFYIKLIVKMLQDRHFDYVVRVLSSSETEAEKLRPLNVLMLRLARQIHAEHNEDIFFKSETRPPMRSVKRLSGPDVLRERVEYVTQDLFVRPRPLTGSALIVDDIANTGASARVYAHALKEFCGVENITSLNLAITRFRGGKDGQGCLKLDLPDFSTDNQLAQRWLDADGFWHKEQDCVEVKRPAVAWLHFIANAKGKACPACAITLKQPRKWWQVWAR